MVGRQAFGGTLFQRVENGERFGVFALALEEVGLVDGGHHTDGALGIGGGDGGIRLGGLSVLFKAKGGGGDFKLDAGLHGAGSSGQECFQRGDAFRALRADKDAAKLKMGFAFHTGLMPLPAADTGDDEHQ